MSATATAAPSKALTKIEGLPSAPLARIEDLRASLESLAGRVNLVCPVSAVDALLPMHQISLRAVVISATVDDLGAGPEVYRGKFCAPNERALGKVALEKIDSAAGVQVVARRRLDDRSQPFYCEIEVTKELRDYDGTLRRTTKTKVVDLRDGSPAALALAKSPASLAQQRSVIQELAETKAGLRATRTLLALKQKYTTDELSRPFVVPKLIPALDPNDPDQKRALIAMATGQADSLFGAPAGEVRELRDVTPPPALLPERGTPPPPVGAVSGDPEEDEADDQGAGGEGAFETLDFTEQTPAASPKVCGCPCGHQVEVSEDGVRVSTAKIQTIRCRSCFPGPSFDYAAHQALRSLEIPAYPGLTAEKVRQAQAKAGK